MKKILFYCIALFVAAELSAQGSITFTEGSSATDIFMYGSPGIKFGQEKDGVYVSLPQAGGGFKFKQEFPVEGNRKYKLDIQAKVNGPDVVEKNSRVPEMQIMSHNLLPGWSMDFFDADGKAVGSRGFNGMTFTSNQKKVYTDIFYAPADAVKMVLNIRMGQNPPESLQVYSPVQLALSPDEGALNCNPEFKYGYAGWNGFLRGALLLENKEGKPVFDTAYGSGGEIFPLAGPGTYRLYGKGTGHGGYRVINFYQLDKDKKTLKTLYVTALPDGNYIDFVIEKDTVYGRINSYNHLLEEVRVTRMGDESMLEKLDAERKAKAAQKK